MNKIKSFLLPILLILLCACQARLGNIEILDNLKVSDISAIYVSKYHDDSYGEYLTENDETTLINQLKELVPIEDKSVDVIDLDFYIIIEVSEDSYDLYLSKEDDVAYISYKNVVYSSPNLIEIYDIFPEIMELK